MRFSALIPVVLSAAALILTFLCLFAGSKKGFMEDYAIVTLNTSRIGKEFFNTTSSNSSNSVVSFFDDIINDVQGEINDKINDVAQDLGLHDFYSAHLLNFCEGYYTPADMPNATISKGDISKNVTNCSNRTAMYNFDPRQMIQRELNESGHGDINLTDLGWPDEVDDAINTLEVASNAMFVLYCIGIAFAGLALISAIISIFFSGRLSAFANIIIDMIAFLAVGIASAIATAIAVKAADVINDKGDRIGISAQKGNKFMILTWVATACLLVASLVWCFDCVVGRRNKNGNRKGSFGQKY